jgi:hypothetical protein
MVHGYSSAESLMEASGSICVCRHSIRTDEKREESKYPSCGRPFADTNQETVHPKHLADAMVEATFDIMAEEGAIWSGAR